MGISFNAKFISGVVRRNEDFLLLLDIDKVYSMSETEIIDALIPQEICE
jgi:chemotaxis signal transduction protein